MKKLLGIVVLGLLLSGNAKAETNEIIYQVTNKIYREWLNNDHQKADEYVYALWSGILTANVASDINNKIKIFCPPKPKLVFFFSKVNFCCFFENLDFF